MYLFLDESFRKHKTTGIEFGVLAGVGVPDAAIRSLQAGVYAVRRPYHGEVLGEDDEIHGKELLRNATFKRIALRGSSYHFNLAKELVDFAAHSRFSMFAVVCFDPKFKTFACSDASELDRTYRCLFDRVHDHARWNMRNEDVKLVFDDRDVKRNRDNARAITNFLIKSERGRMYDTIIPYPFFAVSDGHNYGLQLADVITTVVAKWYEGDDRIKEIWDSALRMKVKFRQEERRWSSIKVLNKPEGA